MPHKGRPPKKKRKISVLKNKSAASDNQTDNNTDSDRGDDSDQPSKNHKDMAGVNRRTSRILILNPIVIGKV